MEAYMITFISIMSFILGSVLTACIFSCIKNKTKELPQKSVIEKKTEEKKSNTNESYVKTELTFQNYFYDWENRWIISSIIKTIKDDKNRFLILTGKSGLGKSHLLHAIQNTFIDKYKNSNICYMVAESFVSEFCSSLREKKLDDFRKKYRELDVLLIDDFNYFCGKESIQEELANTFSALQERGAYVGISITSPCNIKNDYSDRLSSFISNGVKIELPKPGPEAKRSKIMSICNQNLYIMSDKIINRILNYEYDYGMRELTGKLNTLISYKTLVGNSDILVKDVKKVFEEG